MRPLNCLPFLQPTQSRTNCVLSINMLFPSVFYIVAHLTALTWSQGFSYQTLFEDELKPCPTTLPVTDLSLEKLSGKWFLTVLILDAAQEEMEESSVCINGDIFVHNSTRMKQTWDMYTPHEPNFPVGTIEFLVDVVRPGVWSVETPLGTKITATIFGYDLDCALVVHCGHHQGKLVHLWTAGATRHNKLTPPLRIKLSSLLLDNGYNPSTTKIITWTKC